jgi:hypothetical protein
MPRPKGRNVRVRQRLEARERVALMERFEDRETSAPDLALLVTAQGAAAEPLHRWSAYRQGFAPELVRRFLRTAGRGPGPVLDPFAGSGTTTTECARNGVPAIGVEAQASLALCAAARGLPPPRPFEVGDDASPSEAMAIAEDAAQRAAVLLATFAGVAGDGHARQDAPSFRARLRAILAAMHEDLALPRAPLLVLRGDARRLPLATGSAGGILASPPYLGRYDYARITAPIEALLQSPGIGPRRRHQLPATLRRPARGHPASQEPAAEEAARALERMGRHPAARALRGYVHELGLALSEMARVLAPRAPAWIVIAGAAPDGVHVPMELIAAAGAEEHGLRVERILVARGFDRPGRRLGDRTRVEVRECILALRAAAQEGPRQS